MKFERRYTVAGTLVADQVEWEVREASIPGAGFHMPAVEVPRAWSQDATNILAQKYLRKAGVPSNTMRVPEDGMPDWLFRSTASFPGDTTLGSETSARQVFHRMAGCWTYWGWREGYFDNYCPHCGGSGFTGPETGYGGVCSECGGQRSTCDPEEQARTFYDELFWMLANQVAAPNSPQWFNTGLHWAYGIEGPDAGLWTIIKLGGQITSSAVQIGNAYERPQVHACFLTPTTDDLVNSGGIMDTWMREAKIFKLGSGSGINVSSWRARGEPLSGGGRASGVMSFLRIGDSAAGAIQSGGTTRRAAKMVCMDADHPEIEEFVDWKVREEAKAAAMHVGSQVLCNHYQDGGGEWRAPRIAVPDAVLDRMASGFEPEIFGVGWEGEAIRTVDGQNSNNSVRVTDEFVQRVENDETWELTARTTGAFERALPARDLWLKICRAAWASADPGLLFHTTINAWNTCATDGEIRTTNPCFTGDTKVWTVYGPRRFDELANSGDSIPVLTELFDGTLAYRDMITPRMTKNIAKLIQITLKAINRGKYNNISYIRCTPEHVFYLKNGETKKAKDLQANDRIESAYRKLANQKSIMIRSTSGDDVWEHHLVAEYDHGRRPNYPLEHGHHIDDNHSNNTPGNIEILNSSRHTSLHKKGTTLSDRQKQQLSEFAKTRTGDRNPFFGRTHSVEVKNQLSIIASQRTGENNPFFGKSHSDAAREKMQRAWDRRRANTNNHTVVKTKILDAEEPVYCGTVPETGRFFISLGNDHREGVLVSNCSEFMHLDGSACDLASINLCKFVDESKFNCDTFEHACRLWTVVLDISVSMAGFPAREFAEAAYNFRTLGLGYANLGGLLARLDLRYDSDDGRALATGVTALMTGAAYRTSAEVANELGPFPRWEANAESMRRVLCKHQDAIGSNHDSYGNDVWEHAGRAWNDVANVRGGFRNAQVTLLAPTGTIALVMDCATTGIEPFYSRSSVKNLAGGGTMVFTATGVRDEDCAVPLQPGGPCLEPMAHVRMVAAVQPFLSGGVSKTVNLPHGATVADVDDIYRAAHKMGLKSVAVYRDGSKLTQPLVAATLPDGRTMTVTLPEGAIGANVDGKFVKSVEWASGEDGASQRSVKPSAQATAGSNPASPTTLRIHKTLTDEQFHVLNNGGYCRVCSRSMSWSTHETCISTPQPLRRGERRELPSRRPRAGRVKLEVGGQSVYVSTGEHEDGSLGEIFVALSREGSTVRSMMECFSKAVSIGLQYGVPLGVFVDAFVHTKFDPAGLVYGDTRVRTCSSLPDLIARHLAVEYLGREDLASVPRAGDAEAVAAAADRIAQALERSTHSAPHMVMAADVCWECGGHGTLRRTGTCVTCSACGANSGCA